MTCSNPSLLPAAAYESPQDVANTIFSARKSWKTIRGKGEAVWPPVLEQALVKALYVYRPEESRSARALGRFPKRNRFISDFIFEETGTRRSPKQVGSRLQQLKDVNCGKQLLSRVAQCPQGPRRTSPQHDDAPGTLPYAQMGSTTGTSTPILHFDTHPNGWANPPPPPHQPSSSRSSPVSTPPRRLDVYVELQPNTLPGPPAPAAPARVPLTAFHGCLTQPASVYPADDLPARALWHMFPAAVFSARGPVAAQSVARVWCGGRAVHAESHPLVCAPQDAAAAPADEDTFLYSAPVAPAYWATLCGDHDVSRYTIVQDIVSNLDLPGSRQGQAILSVVYHFTYFRCESESPSPIDSVIHPFDAELQNIFPEQGGFGAPAAVAVASEDFGALSHGHPGFWGMLPGHQYAAAGFDFPSQNAQALTTFPDQCLAIGPRSPGE